MKKKGLPIESLVPEYEVISGAHVPSGENLWTFPTVPADEEENEEEENLHKSAIGLFDIPTKDSASGRVETPEGDLEVANKFFGKDGPIDVLPPTNKRYNSSEQDMEGLLKSLFEDLDKSGRKEAAKVVGGLVKKAYQSDFDSTTNTILNAPEAKRFKDIPAEYASSSEVDSDNSVARESATTVRTPMSKEPIAQHSSLNMMVQSEAISQEMADAIREYVKSTNQNGTALAPEQLEEWFSRSGEDPRYALQAVSLAVKELRGSSGVESSSGKATPHGQKGSIQPAGDPYTYDYVVEGDYFVVASGPRPALIGSKFPKGTQVYENLKSYIPSNQEKQTFVSTNPQAATAPTDSVTGKPIASDPQAPTQTPTAVPVEVTQDEALVALQEVLQGIGDVMVETDKGLGRGLRGEIASRQVKRYVRQLGGPEAATAALDLQAIKQRLAKIQADLVRQGNPARFVEKKSEYLRGLIFEELRRAWGRLSKQKGRIAERRERRVRNRGTRRAERAARRAER